MRLPLDTHAFGWWDDGKLPKAVIRRIQRADEVLVSAVVAWEISIKAGIGKIQARASVAKAIVDYGFTDLPIAVATPMPFGLWPCTIATLSIACLRHRALVEDLVLVSVDAAFAAYKVPVVRD